jgi:hypothetical protein
MSLTAQEATRWELVTLQFSLLLRWEETATALQRKDVAKMLPGNAFT